MKHIRHSITSCERIILWSLANKYDLSRKLVIIGDGACGKTSLLSVFTLGYFPTVSHGIHSFMGIITNCFLSDSIMLVGLFSYKSN